MHHTHTHLQVMEDDALALAAGLSSLVPPSLSELSTTLGGISSDLQTLGGTRVGSLIQQVRESCEGWPPALSTYI